MGYVNPSGTIQLFRGINLDNRYMHTLYFPNTATQTTFFDGLVDPNLQFTNQSYSRVNRQVIKLKINAESVQSCTYMRFNNRGNKWYYCFITGIEYVNENTTAIAYEIDVLQTWFFQSGLSPENTIKSCYILREHVAPSDDVFTKYLEPEPIGSDVYTMDYLQVDKAESDFNGYSLVINSSSQPDAEKLVRDGIVNGTKFMVFDPYESAVNIVNQMEEMLGSWDKQEQSAEIVDMYMFPKFFAGAMDNDGNYYEDSQPHNTSQYIITHPKKYDNYTPQNKKLFAYPYSFLYATTMDGDTANYQWEYFEGNVTADGSTIEFDVDACATGGGSIECHPRSYNGIDHNYDAKISITNFPKCAWAYDAYQAFVASGGQTKAYYNAEIVDKKGMNAKRKHFLGDSAKAIAAGVAAVGAAALVPAGAGAAAIMAAAAPGTLAATRQTIGMTLTQNADEIRMDEALHKISFQFSDAQYEPNMVVGNATPNIAVGAGFLGFRFYHCHVRDDEMVKLDNFLTTFGYAINDFGVPNLNTRPYWNFIQTQNCVIHGNMPASSKEAIGRIFDGGLFLWNYQHGNDNIGNFTRKNSHGQLLNR